VEGLETDAVLAELWDHVHEILERAAIAVERGDDQGAAR
jgi:hypothetical protein